MTLNKLKKVLAYKKRDEEIKQFIRSFKQHPCTDCGIQYDFLVMEFDHCRGKKSFTLSAPGRRSKETILEELKKCDLVCANCHRVRTLKRSKEAMALKIDDSHKKRIQAVGLKMISELEGKILEIREIIGNF